MIVHPMALRIAEFLDRYAKRPPAGLDQAQFRHYVDTRRAETSALVEALLPYAEGLLLPVRNTGGAWGVTREMRPDGSGWRVTRFDADMVPMGHHSHERAAVAVEDVLGWADRTRMHQAQFGRHDITLTSAFQAWFGDSKVVDADGRPLEVYHGTQSSFTTFKTPAWFTPSAHIADAFFATKADGSRTHLSKVIPAYLSIQRPLFTSDWDVTEPNAAMRRRFSEWEQEGYDGIIFASEDGDEVEYIAFRPEQIKSVINDHGSFDLASCDIRFSQPDENGGPEVDIQNQPAPRRSRGLGW